MKKPLILIPCSDRKLQTPNTNCLARNQTSGNISDVAENWVKNLRSSQNTFTQTQIYCGRSILEARKAAASFDANLLVISAGLGLVDNHARIPSYGLTVSEGHEDSISKVITQGPFTPNAWWESLKQTDYGLLDFSNYFDKEDPPLILLHLTKHYARMVQSELKILSEDVVSKIRIFGIGLESYIPKNLQNCIMPYDHRMNGPDSPLKGAMTDFGSRSIRHFIELILDSKMSGEPLDIHKKLVVETLSQWRVHPKPNRQKLTDEEVIRFINSNWDAVSGISNKMLKLLRTSGNACEQTRFKKLFIEAKKNNLSQLGLDL